MLVKLLVIKMLGKINKDIGRTVTRIVDSTYGDKEIHRAVDNILASLHIAQVPKSDKRDCVNCLRRTLCDLGYISNLAECDRSPTVILHMYTLALKLGLYIADLCALVGECFGDVANRPLARIICNRPRTLRVISLRSLHEGRAEHFFREVRTLVSTCSSHNPSNYVDDVVNRVLLELPTATCSPYLLSMVPCVPGPLIPYIGNTPFPSRYTVITKLSQSDQIGRAHV